METPAIVVALPIRLFVIANEVRQSSIVNYSKRRMIQTTGSDFNSIWPAAAKSF